MGITASPIPQAQQTMEGLGTHIHLFFCQCSCTFAFVSLLGVCVCDKYKNDRTEETTEQECINDVGAHVCVY